MTTSLVEERTWRVMERERTPPSGWVGCGGRGGRRHVLRKGQLLITRALLGHYHAELHKVFAAAAGDAEYCSGVGDFSTTTPQYPGPSVRGKVARAR